MDDDLRSRIKAHLGPTEKSPGILHRQGRVLMSGWDTVAPGRFYVVGSNPGGRLRKDPPVEETIGASIDQHATDWNYFATSEAAGAHADRVLPVFEKLGADPERTITSNALFLRSPTEGALPSDARPVWRNHCAAVHADLIGIVTPKVLVCFGIKSWKLLTGRRDPGHWRFNPDVTFRLANKEYSCGVLLLPHFSPQALRYWTKYAPTLDQAQANARAYAYASP